MYLLLAYPHSRLRALLIVTHAPVSTTVVPYTAGYFETIPKPPHAARGLGLGIVATCDATLIGLPTVVNASRHVLLRYDSGRGAAGCAISTAIAAAGSVHGSFCRKTRHVHLTPPFWGLRINDGSSVTSRSRPLARSAFWPHRSRGRCT